MSDQWRLLVECADQEGLVHKITGVLYRAQCNVLVNHEFADLNRSRFFMRTEFSGSIARDAIIDELRQILPPESSVRLICPGKKRLVIMASREHHCLADLVTRCVYDELDAEIAGVISNHDTLRPLVEMNGLPFVHLPHEDVSRDEHERQILEKLDELQPDYVVLAKYMRILGPEFVKRFSNRIINIHHSFLPAFIGAKPYHQAWERGVKVIGATAHFVTNELDQGPIIEQQVINVDHTHGPKDMARAGRDVERMVLARALRVVTEDRVFLNGNRTVIFD